MESDSSGNSILAVVANYGFSAAADALKLRLARHFPTLLIDNSSSPPPRHADVVLPNYFYVGLWNEAVRLARDRGATWLVFCASDVQIEALDECAFGIREATSDEAIGLYAPAVTPGSRTSFPGSYLRSSGGMRQVHVVEGFFFVCRAAILASIYPVDPIRHKYGWGIDVLTAYRAMRMGYATVVDDRSTIHHPTSIHSIDEEAANQQSLNLCSEPAFYAFRERVYRAQFGLRHDPCDPPGTAPHRARPSLWQRVLPRRTPAASEDPSRGPR